MIPEKLQLVNFFSHKDSEIDFSEFSSALLIGNTEGDYSKSNGSGKSTIFEGMLWCLFNKSRQAMMDDIVKWGETSCSVSLDFKHAGSTYRVVRTRNRMNSTSSVSLFQLDKANDWVDISGSTAGDTNSKIEELIKLEYKTFVNSVYFRQNDISEFAEAEASKKKEILKSIIDISRWDEYEKRAKKASKDISLECKVLSKATEKYDEEYEALLLLGEEIKEKNSVIASLEAEAERTNGSIDAYTKRYNDLKSSLDTNLYDKAAAKLASLEAEKLDAEKLFSSSKSQVKNLKDDLDKILEKKRKIEVFLSQKEYIEVDDTKVKTLRDDLIKYKSEKALYDGFVKSLDEIKISEGECYVCRQSISEDLHEHLVADIGRKRKEYLDKKLIAINTLHKTEEELDHLNKVIEINKKIKKANETLEEICSTESMVKRNFEEQEGRLNIFKEKLNKINKEIEDNTSILDSIKNDDFQMVREELKKLKKTKEDIQMGLSKHQQDLGRLLERQNLSQSMVDKMLEDKKSISKKMEKATLFLKLSKMFGKNGIQALLLDSIIEDLEKTSNTILSSMCNEPSTIVLETQRTGADGTSIIETLDLKVRKDGNLQSFKSLSGGEKFRISLSLRIALSEISSRYGGSSLEFLLLDEVNSPLDRYGVETLFVNVIKSLEEKYKIMVITHDESLKEKFENIIDSTKVNGETEVVITRR